MIINFIFITALYDTFLFYNSKKKKIILNQFNEEDLLSIDCTPDCVLGLGNINE